MMKDSQKLLVMLVVVQKSLVVHQEIREKQKNKSTSAVKKPKTAAAPKKQWYTAHDWLEYRNVNEKILMFCTMCKQAGYKNQMAKGLGTYKKDLVDRHVKNQEHDFLENAKKIG